MARLLPAPLRDALLQTLIAVVGVTELAGLHPPGWGYGAALEVASCSLLVWRRRHPLVLGTLAGTVTLMMPWFGPQLNEPSTPIVILALVTFSLAR